MIAYGPAAAAAVLGYLEATENGRTRPALSPKSREALAWVRAVKGDPPLRLRNALEYLLLNLKTSGVELDDLFASSSAPPAVSGQPAESTTVPKKAAVSGDQKFPPLPDHAVGRLDLLRAHADALEDLGMWKRTFDQRKALAVAVRKLRERSQDLRSTEVAELQMLYEELRRGGKDGRK
jgi:hypothetical protein